MFRRWQWVRRVSRVSTRRSQARGKQLRPVLEQLEDRIAPVAGTITADTTWSTDQEITASVTIAAGATLTVQPGVTVKVDAGQGLYVDGNLDSNGHAAHLVAQGTATQPILFTSAATTPAKGDWSRIEIDGPNGTATLDQ